MRYTIKKGRHYCGINIRCHTKITNYEVLAKFKSNCWYDEPKNGKNKLSGFTEGIMNIYRRSIMIAWQPDFYNVGMINLYAYWYDDNTRRYTADYKCIFLTSVPVEKYFKITVAINRDSNTATFKYKNNGESAKLTAPYTSPLIKFGRYVFPYHGGKFTAPKDETIIMCQHVRD